MNKFNLFTESATLLRQKLDIIPLLYGSLGLEYLTKSDLGAEDIDVLIPQVFLLEKWQVFRSLLEQQGYTLTDEREHTFEKDGVSFSYASIEELESFALIPLEEIKTVNETFKVLTLEQYLKVYTASQQDGYRIMVRQKKDAEKIRFIREQLHRTIN